MITIIHGDDTTKSREFYLNERQKHPEKILLEGTTLTLTDFLQATSGNGLFGDQQAIFIEDLFSKRKPSKELDTLISQISQTAQTSLFLYESKELTKTQLKSFPDATIKQFSIPKTVFAFLDALSPENGKKSLTLFHELLATEDVNFALFMLQRQVRILLSLQTQSNKNDPGQARMTISEVSRLAPWQRGKLEKQAKAFTQDQLLNLHESLYQLELGQKTGQLSQPLVQAIDFLLVSM